MNKDEVSEDDTHLTWWRKQQKEFRRDILNFDLEQCDSCKYIGGVGMIASGSYVGYVGYHRAQRSGSRYGFIPSAVFAAALGTFGVIRLFGYNPFSSSGKSTGIDLLDPVKDFVNNTLMKPIPKPEVGRASVEHRDSPK